MILLLTGLAVFLGTHVFSAIRPRTPGKDLRKRFGEGPYMATYSLVALAGFVMIVYGYGASRGAGVLYVPPTWLQHLNLLLMVPALILLVASQLPAGHIKKATKHPMLVSIKLWAVGHLLANGEVNSVILFGAFLAYAVFDRIMVKRRGDNGPVPNAAISSKWDGIAVVTGLAAYVAILVWLHPILFGVRALPA